MRKDQVESSSHEIHKYHHCLLIQISPRKLMYKISYYEIKEYHHCLMIEKSSRKIHIVIRFLCHKLFFRRAENDERQSGGNLIRKSKKRIDVAQQPSRSSDDGDEVIQLKTLEDGSMIEVKEDHGSAAGKARFNLVHF